MSTSDILAVRASLYSTTRQWDVLSGFCEYQNDRLKGSDSVSGPGSLGEEFLLDDGVTIHYTLATATSYLSNRWQNSLTRAERSPTAISNGRGLFLSFLPTRVCERDDDSDFQSNENGSFLLRPSHRSDHSDDVGGVSTAFPRHHTDGRMKEIVVAIMLGLMQNDGCTPRYPCALHGTRCNGSTGKRRSKYGTRGWITYRTLLWWRIGGRLPSRREHLLYLHRVTPGVITGARCLR